MNIHKQTGKILMPILVSGLLLGACGQVAESQASASTSSSSETTAATASSATDASGDTTTSTYGTYEEEDLETTYDEAEAVTINLSDDGTEASDGVTVDGSTVTITQAGTYVINGSLSDGQLQVSVGAEDKVHIILNGVTINNNDGAAINITEGEKVITTLASGTENTLTDGSSYTLATDETEPDATFYSKADLVINGDGKLVIEGNYSNGIRSKDDLILVSGEYDITAVNNGIKAKDNLSILDGTYTVTTSEGDGLQADNEDEADLGNVYIDGGSFTINAGRDGVQAISNLMVQNAEMTITTADGASSTSVDTAESYKGLKSTGAIEIASGTINIDSADDAIHANATISVLGGTINAASGDDGMHADTNLSISGGTVDIQQSYEGLESSIIDIAGGEINVVASDDGLNAGGGSDTETTTGTFGADSFGGQMGGGMEADESKELNISGGTLIVDSEGDGLDSNGIITMTDGLVIVNGTTSGGNGSLDYGSSFDLSGGTLVATGTSDMAQNASTASQTSVGITYDTTQEAGTLVSLVDADGNTVFSFSPTKTYSHVVISTADLATGDYTLVSGGTNDGTESNGYYTDGSVSGGTELATLSITDTITNLTSTGETATATGMMGGGGPQF
ncbi:carbohydrate-binding domain-containing protein [Aerococcus agrisoli]|uniref:Carbohydrate-binding domain-containing protein n=2 Tax=Aerococcus agrisoli TaxID=2487350 RepID=A0A3N4GQ26_9LACT|nr:carbohydrate-binding domain-containing protein [Aerococcus agrisoli]